MALDTEIITRLKKLELKFDVLWAFQMRRALSETIQKGIGKLNSPLQITDEAISWMKELADPLRDFYLKFGLNLSDNELMFEIEKHFGDEILDKVCIPNGLSEGSCLLIAMQVAKTESKAK